MEPDLTIDASADIDTLDTQIKLALADALHFREGRGDLDCLIAHLQRLYDLNTVEQLFKEFVYRASTYDGLNNDDIAMGDLLAGVEQVALTVSYWSKIDTSYTPETRAYERIQAVLDQYREETSADN